VRESFRLALAPLESRLKRYHDAEQRARDRAARAQLRREEVEFKEMMKNWLAGVDENALEEGFLGVCMWQVQNSHLRDVARDRHRMRTQHRKIAVRHKSLPTAPLRWVGKHAYSAWSAQRVRPMFPAKLPLHEFERRVDALVSCCCSVNGCCCCCCFDSC
jgi:hypothetical protein